MEWAKSKIVDPLMDQLKSGVSPEKLALSLALGVVGGVFPVPGLTTLPCVLFTVLFSLNPVAPQVVNILVTPLCFMGVPIFMCAPPYCATPPLPCSNPHTRFTAAATASGSSARPPRRSRWTS